MDEDGNLRLSGRQAQAARNDLLILEAAREVFTANPEAPISAVAERAGVGISALYRRDPSKADLLRRLTREGQERYIAETELALADEGDPWQAFARFMRRVVEADTHSLTLHLAGTFAPTDEQWREGDRAAELTIALLERTKRSGGLRPEIELGDMTMLFEQLAAISLGDRARTNELRQRYLSLMLEALRSDTSPLPGSAPTWEEISARFSNEPGA
jgi:AcrR family transcriptional regulator